MAEWSIPDALQERIQGHLTILYGPERGTACSDKLSPMLGRFAQRNPGLIKPDSSSGDRLNESDAILITYGDQLTEPKKPPLQSLGEFLEQHLGGVRSH